MTETVKLRGEGGSVFTFDLPLPAGIEAKLAKGYLRRVDEPGQPAVDQTPERPAQSATKAEWVGYAVHKHGLSPDEAEAMTKSDLIELTD